MSDFIPKPGIKIGGLSRKAQKLQALREKAAASDDHPSAKPPTPTPALKANTAGQRKASFQRKAV